MKKNRAIIIILAAFLSTTACAQLAKPVADLIKVPGPIVFRNKSFNLSWSSHPAVDLYKQEYIEKGVNPDKYRTMILIDVISGQTNIKDRVDAKIAELTKMKETNPMVQFQTFNNPKLGEYMIDFLLSANTPDGKALSIVERNVYKYKLFTNAYGQKGVMLFGVSTRSYGDEIDKFFASLKTSKTALVNDVAAFKIPEIMILK